MKANVKSVILAVGLVLGLVGLSACGESSGEKAAKSANQQIDRMNNISAALSQKGIAIDLSAHPDSARAVPSDMSADDLMRAHALLTEYTDLGEKVLATAKRKDVKMGHSDTVPKLQHGVDDANNWIAKIERKIIEVNATKNPRKK